MALERGRSAGPRASPPGRADTNRSRPRYERAGGRRARHHSMPERPCLQVSPFETAFQAAAVHFSLRKNGVDYSRAHMPPPPAPIPVGREASLGQKRHLISSGASQRQRGSQCPAPQVTPVPRRAPAPAPGPRALSKDSLEPALWLPPRFARWAWGTRCWVQASTAWMLGAASARVWRMKLGLRCRCISGTSWRGLSSRILPL